MGAHHWHSSQEEEQPHSAPCCEEVVFRGRTGDLGSFWLLPWSLLQLWPLQVWTSGQGDSLWTCPGLHGLPKTQGVQVSQLGSSSIYLVSQVYPWVLAPRQQGKVHRNGKDQLRGQSSRALVGAIPKTLSEQNGKQLQ